MGFNSGFKGLTALPLYTPNVYIILYSWNSYT